MWVGGGAGVLDFREEGEQSLMPSSTSFLFRWGCQHGLLVDYFFFGFIAFTENNFRRWLPFILSVSVPG